MSNAPKGANLQTYKNNKINNFQTNQNLFLKSGRSIMFYLFFFLSITLTLGAYFVCKYALKINSEKFNNVISKTLKISVIVYCALSLLSILLPNSILLCYSQEELNSNPIPTGLAIVEWLSKVAFIVLPLAIFTKNKTIRNIAIYFSTIITLTQIIMYPMYLDCFTSEIGRGLNSISVLSAGFKEFLRNPIFRSFVIGIIWLLELCIPVILAVQEKHIFEFKNKKAYGYFFMALALIILSVMPIYVPQYLFGYTNLIFEAWSLPHILWLISVIAEIVIIYFALRKKDTSIKMLVLYVLALSLLMQYNQMFGAISLNIERLPFQLCNIGSYLILVALITKSKKIFDFTVIVNVVGVIFALAVPDLDGEGLFYLYNMHFILEHTNVLVVPILALLLNIFPRLDKKSFKHFFIGFAIYFVAMLILGTLFNGIANHTGNSFYSANYLFMFDQETAYELVPLFGKLFDTKINIGAITIYPVIQPIVYVVFNLICCAIFGIIQLIYFTKDKLIKKENTSTTIESEETKETEQPKTTKKTKKAQK